jgi:hypothetical protein
MLLLNFKEVPDIQNNICSLEYIKGPFKLFGVKRMPEENRSGKYQ